jgi:TonB family protein
MEWGMFVRTGYIALICALAVVGANAQALNKQLACPSSGALTIDPPEYPTASSRACEEGRVVVGLCLAPNGRPETVELLYSSGFPRLDEATMKWACRVQHQPATDSSGAPVRTCASVFDYTFRLRDYPRWRTVTSHFVVLPDSCAEFLPPDFKYQPIQ